MHLECFCVLKKDADHIRIADKMHQWSHDHRIESKVDNTDCARSFIDDVLDGSPKSFLNEPGRTKS
jgi:hypothetical protein